MNFLRKKHVLNGRYKVIDVIGRGGQGAVYKVSDTHVFDKVLAAKEILAEISDDLDSLILFKKEAVFLSSLSHSGLPVITDFFKVDSKYYIIMEYISGKNLEEVLIRYPDFFSEKRVIEIALFLCDILKYTHSIKPNPLIFRDIKPANIIYNKNKIKLVDLGTARFFDERKTQDTIHFGTIGYAPPEQYNGTTDCRSDIYSFGVTLFHLLTKQDPRDGRPLPEGGVSTKKYNKGISDDINNIIKKMTIKNIEKRYQNVDEIERDLENCSSIKICPKCKTVNSSRKAKCFACNSDLEITSKELLSQIYQLIGVNDNKVFEFNRPMLTIGRSPDNDIILNYPSISRNHAILKKEKNGFFIADLGSKSGTYIKTGKMLKKIKKNLIRPGWNIRFGKDVEFTFKKKEKAYK